MNSLPCTIGLLVLLAACEPPQTQQEVPPSQQTPQTQPSQTQAPPMQPESLKTQQPLPQAQANANAKIVPASDLDSQPGLSVLRAVRVGGQGEAERVVFEFDGKLPRHKLAYTRTPPIQCASAAVVPLSGAIYLTITFRDAAAHTESGVASGAPRDVAYMGRNIKQLKQICDFEGIVEWAIGLADSAAYSVLELAQPTRLAVDVRVKP